MLKRFKNSSGDFNAVPSLIAVHTTPASLARKSFLFRFWNVCRSLAAGQEHYHLHNLSEVKDLFSYLETIECVQICDWSVAFENIPRRSRDRLIMQIYFFYVLLIWLHLNRIPLHRNPRWKTWGVIVAVRRCNIYLQCKCLQNKDELIVCDNLFEILLI